MTIRRGFGTVLALVAIEASIFAWGLQARAAGAQGNIPEYYYQPASGVMQLSFDGHQLLSGATSQSIGGARTHDIKYGNVGFGVAYGYGFSDAWAFRAQMASDTTTIDFTDTTGSVSSYKRTGRSDVTLMLTNVSDFSGWNIYAGLGAGLSPGKHLDESAVADGNHQTGGTSIINYLGLSSTIGSGNYWGAKLQYITRSQRSANTNSATPQDYSLSGGNETAIAAFAQTDLAGLLADFAVTYIFIDPSVAAWGGAATTTTNATRILRLDAGSQYQLTTSVNMRLAYVMKMNEEQVSGTVSLAAYQSSELVFRLRFEF